MKMKPSYMTTEEWHLRIKEESALAVEKIRAAATVVSAYIARTLSTVSSVEFPMFLNAINFLTEQFKTAEKSEEGLRKG